MLSSGGWLSTTSFEMSPVVLVAVEEAVVVDPKSDMVVGSSSRVSRRSVGR